MALHMCWCRSTDTPTAGAACGLFWKGILCGLKVCALWLTQGSISKLLWDWSAYNRSPHRRHCLLSERKTNIGIGLKLPDGKIKKKGKTDQMSALEKTEEEDYKETEKVWLWGADRVMGIKSIAEPERGLTRAMIYTFIFQNYWSTNPLSLLTYLLSICLSIYLYIHFYISQPIPPIHKTIDIPTKLLIYQSMYISTYLSSSYQLYIFLPTNVAISVGQ